MHDEYWIVTLKAYAFETEADACAFRERLEDAFCDLNAAGEYGCSTIIEKESE